MATPLTGTTAPPLIVTPGGVSPRDAVRAYQDVDGTGTGGTSTNGTSAGADFGGMVERAVEGTVSASHDAENQAMTAIAGGGNLTDVVQAVSHAELALQITTAIRDRVVSAYQDIMKMPI
jgi:flagellar hook-basal body complex protein FliE